MEELSYVLTEDFFSWVHVRFYFYFTTAHFLLAGRWHFSFSHCRYEIFRFFFQRNSSPLFSITRSSSFSVIHVSVNITNNVEKDTTLFFFLSESPGGHEISFQIKPWVLFGLPYLLIELSYIGVPVCGRTGGWAVGRTYGHVTTKISRMHSLPNFLTHGALRCTRFARERAPLLQINCQTSLLTYVTDFLLPTSYRKFSYVIRNYPLFLNPLFSLTKAK